MEISHTLGVPTSGVRKAAKAREFCMDCVGARQATHTETYSKFHKWSCLQWYNVIQNFVKNVKPVKKFKWKNARARTHTHTHLQIPVTILINIY